MSKTFSTLLREIKACDVCAYHLRLPPKPVVQLNPLAKIMIIAQAPGMRARTSGLPFDDKSGDRLRSWLGVDQQVFYDETKMAFMAMGFCYPGKTSQGDLPPCQECAPLWHPQVWRFLKHVKLTLLVGSYAQRYYLPRGSVLHTVQNWRSHLPTMLPLPHPSWHNNAWIKNQPWFMHELIPELRERVRDILQI